MKRLVFIFSLIFMSTMALVAQEVRKVKSNAEMAFTSLSHDYGSIVYGADGTYSFSFKNNAEKPIVITNVKSSCGCTIPSWPKEPIQPGKTGSITVKYNTKLAGSFNKTVQVFSTAANSPVKLSIRGKVNAKPSDLKSTDQNSKLLNGSKVKKGMEQAISEESKELMSEASEVSSEGKSNTNPKSKQSINQGSKQVYKKKIEAQKKTKK